MVTGTYISITTLNVNGLNAPTKRHRLAEWIQKQDPYTCCLQQTHFRPKDTYRLKVRGRKSIFHANGNQKKYGVVYFGERKHEQSSESRKLVTCSQGTESYLLWLESRIEIETG